MSDLTDVHTVGADFIADDLAVDELRSTNKV